MNSGISKKLIISFFLFFNFIQPTKAAEFHKINKNENNQLNQFFWSKISDNKISSNTQKVFWVNNIDNISVDKDISEGNSPSLLNDLSKNQEELIIKSDQQSEKNNVIYAEGNVSVSFRGKTLTADNLIFDKSRKKISAEGNITIVFGKQILKLSKLEYNLTDETGYLLDVRGSLNSEKLIADISRNFYNSDIPELHYLLNLQKTEVLNTPNEVNNWIFSTERISIDGKKWRSDKVIFSNDILQFKQVKIEINSLEAYSLKEELRFKSSLNYLVLDENVSIPFWLGNRALTESEQNFDPKSSWTIGYDKLDNDGLFLGRKLNSINLSDNFIIDLEPQFLIQRSLTGKTKSFVKKGDLVTGERVKRDAEFSDFFGFKSKTKGKINNWDLEIDKKINSFDINKFSDSFRLKSTLSKKINFLDAKWDKSFYGVYRDRVWNGSLGEAEIYTGYGSKLERKRTWEVSDITYTEVLSLGLAQLKGEALSSKNLIDSLKGNLFYSIDQNIPLSIDQTKNKTIDSSYEYIYEPTKEGLSLNTRLAGLYSLYEDGQHQEYIGFGFGPEFIFGNFKNKTFDYTRISIFPFYKFQNGESIFKFDQISDKFTFNIAFDQQLFGPIILQSEGTYNLDVDSDDYQKLIDSKISLNWKKRSYEFGIFYKPHNEAGGISFSLFGFE